MKLLKPLMLVLFVAVTATGYGQQTNFTLTEASTMTIEGTSTIHDWEADVEEFSLDISLNPALLQTAEEGESFVPSLSLEVPVESIESGKRGMNNKIYDALKEKDHPTISFTLTSADIVFPGEESSVANSDSFTVKTSGNLSIAGITRQIDFDVKGIQVAADTFKFSGSYHMNMKDYQVDPPSAIFGTIKAGEEIDIFFDLTVVRQSTVKTK